MRVQGKGFLVLQAGGTGIFALASVAVTGRKSLAFEVELSRGGSAARCRGYDLSNDRSIQEVLSMAEHQTRWLVVGVK